MARPPKVEVIDAQLVDVLDGERVEQLRALAWRWRQQAAALRGAPVNMRDLFSFVADTVAGTIDESRAAALDECADALFALVGEGRAPGK